MNAKLISIGILAFSLLSTMVATAADPGIPTGSGPGGVPDGAGLQRGIGGLNNSGQEGFVTLFDRGARSAIVVAVDGANGHLERVAIMRGKSCDSIGAEVVRLADLEKGLSRGYVDFTTANLASGKFLTVVYGTMAPNAKPVACGELYN